MLGEQPTKIHPDYCEGMEPAEIRYLVASTQEFKEYFKTMIDDLHEAILGYSPSEERRETILQRFVQDSNYDINALCNDLRKTHNETPIVTQHIEEEEPTKPLDDIVDEFEYIFKRCMTVHEYRKYNGLNIDMRSLLKFHNENIAEANRVSKMYTTENIDMMMFMRYILPKLELASNNKSLIEEIIVNISLDDSRYKVKLTERMEDIYYSLYDCKPSYYDKEYMFLKAKTARVNLIDDGARDIVTSTKAETEKFCYTIENTYQQELDRFPDEEELQDALIDFRNGHLTENSLRNNLVCSLEFIDVLKNYIMTQITKKTQITKNKPSLIYKVLQNTIDAKPASFTQAKELVDKFINT